MVPLNVGSLDGGMCIMCAPATWLSFSQTKQLLAKMPSVRLQFECDHSSKSSRGKGWILLLLSGSCTYQLEIPKGFMCKIYTSHQVAAHTA